MPPSSRTDPAPSFARLGDYLSAQMQSNRSFGYGLFVCRMQAAPGPVCSTFWLYANQPSPTYAPDIAQLWNWNEIDFEFVPHTRAEQAAYLSFEGAALPRAQVDVYGARLALGDPRSQTQAPAAIDWVKGLVRSDDEIARAMWDYYNTWMEPGAVPGAAPTGGVIVLEDGESGARTAALAYDADAKTVQSALDGLNDGAGLFGLKGGYVVSGMQTATGAGILCAWSVTFTTPLETLKPLTIHVDGLSPAGSLGRCQPGLLQDGTITNFIVSGFQPANAPAAGQSWWDLLVAETGDGKIWPSAESWKYPAAKAAAPSGLSLKNAVALNIWRAPAGDQSISLTLKGWGEISHDGVLRSKPLVASLPGSFISACLNNEAYAFDRTGVFTPYEALNTYTIAWSPTAIAQYINAPENGRDISNAAPVAAYGQTDFPSLDRSGPQAPGGLVRWLQTPEGNALGEVSFNLANYVAFDAAGPGANTLTAAAATTSGSAVITLSTKNAGVAVQQSVTGPGIPAGAVVLAVDDTTVTLNKAATANASSASLTFTARPAGPGWSGPPPASGFTGTTMSVQALGWYPLRPGAGGDKTSDFDFDAPDRLWLDFSDGSWTPEHFRRDISQYFGILFAQDFTKAGAEPGVSPLRDSKSPLAVDLALQDEGGALMTLSCEPSQALPQRNFLVVLPIQAQAAPVSANNPVVAVRIAGPTGLVLSRPCEQTRTDASFLLSSGQAEFILSATGDMVSGSPIVRNVVTGGRLRPGMSVEGAGLAPGTTVDEVSDSYVAECSSISTPTCLYAPEPGESVVLGVWVWISDLAYWPKDEEPVEPYLAHITVSTSASGAVSWSVLADPHGVLGAPDSAYPYRITVQAPG